MAKVEVYMPCRDGKPYELARIVASIEALAHKTGVCTITREPVTLARNQATRKFLKTNATHMLMVDDDTVIMTRGAIDRLLALDADIAAGLVPWWDGVSGLILNAQCEPNVWLKPWPTGTFPVWHVGTAIMMIARRVFELIEWPWFQWRESREGDYQGEDLDFCRKAREKGCSIMVDAGVIGDHFKTIPLTAMCPPLPENGDYYYQGYSKPIDLSADGDGTD